MMTLLTILLSVLLIADCLVLTLLVLVQLPKKDAGAGMAFGGGAADALFGAGSGNALTKLTKYTAITFFVVVLLLCIIDKPGNSSNRLKNAIESTSTETRPVAAPVTAAPAATPLPAASSNTGVSLTIGSNSPPASSAPVVAPPATNIPPK
jgi:preprotein translocase subunit SecG